MIYNPREDSFLLAKYVKLYSKDKKVLDLGTGSGIQAEIALSSKAKSVLASDINQEAVDLCKRKNISVIKSDIFSNIKSKFDLIIFNPPYLPLEKKEDKESQLTTTGGKKGYELIERFLKEAQLYLNKNGKILIVFSSLTGNINKIIKKYNYKYTMLTQKNLFFETIYVYLIETFK